MGFWIKLGNCIAILSPADNFASCTKNLAKAEFVLGVALPNFLCQPRYNVEI